VLMKMSKDQESFYANHQLPELGGMNVSLKIVMDVDTSHSFIAGFKLQHIDDIDRINYNYLWTRYLNSEGAFYAKHRELKHEIGFRLISFKTIVFCKELNFYAEENKHLTMPDEFESWVEKKY
jgi:hypothetical protein